MSNERRLAPRPTPWCPHRATQAHAQDQECIGSCCAWWLVLEEATVHAHGDDLIIENSPEGSCGRVVDKDEHSTYWCWHDPNPAAQVGQPLPDWMIYEMLIDNGDDEGKD